MSRVIADGLSDKALALISSSIDADTLDGIDSLGFDAAGAADTAVSDHVALPDPHSQYAEIAGGANANFTTMPQVGGDPIVESGSNADGEWTRWADGTQAVFFRPWALTNSSPKDATRTFPAAFVDTDYIISLSYGNTVVANLSGTYVGTDSSQNATTSARFYGESVFSGGGTWTAHTTILGRYK